MPRVQHEEDTVNKNEVLHEYVLTKELNKVLFHQSQTNLCKALIQNFSYIAKESMSILPKLTELQAETLKQIKTLVN